MDEHLGKHDWLAGNAFSLADIALYAYTHVADEGGFDLAAYPQLMRWMNRIASLPGHIVIQS
jgi:glutathione S-transferase